MSGVASQTELEQMQRLYALREKRALEAVSEQRKELDRVLDRIEEQRALIAEIEVRLLDLHQLRDVDSIHEMTAVSLRLESDRRRMLARELDEEKFYMPSFEADVQKAQLELDEKKKDWSRIGDQQKALEQLAHKQKIERIRSQSRKEDAMLDDRRKVIQR